MKTNKKQPKTEQSSVVATGSEFKPFQSVPGGILKCGARRKRDGQPCQQHGMKTNGRCRVHGGASTGAPLGNTNNYKHGFYYNALSAEEKALWPEAVAMGSGANALESDLALMRVKLQRLLVAANDPSLSLQIEQTVDLIMASGLLPSRDEMRAQGYNKRELKTSLPRIGALIVEAVETIRKLSLSIAQLRVSEKELASDAPGDTDYNFTFVRLERKKPEEID
jgi:hypothetical protein